MKQRTRPINSGEDWMTSNMNNNKKNDGDNNCDVQLHKIRPQEHFIEAQVQEGDTLQAIALRFYCPISELKRINHIHKDNEIFAKRTIKVPVTPYSVLTEVMPTPQDQPTPSSSSYTPSKIALQPLIHNLDQNIMQNKNTDESNSDYAIDCNAVVLNSMLAPSVVPYTDKEQDENVSEDTHLLPNKEKVSVEAVVVKELTSHGADFGLKWFHLVCLMLFLGVVIPLVYILFYLEKPEHPDIAPLQKIS